MGAAANAGTAGEIAPWHAMSADEVVKRLATNVEKGLDARRGLGPAREIWAEPSAGGQEARPVHAVPRAFQQHPRLRSSRCRVHQLMLSLWVDAAIIFVVVVLNRLLFWMKSQGSL